MLELARQALVSEVSHLDSLLNARPAIASTSSGNGARRSRSLRKPIKIATASTGTQASVTPAIATAGGTPAAPVKRVVSPAQLAQLRANAKKARATAAKRRRERAKIAVANAQGAQAGG